MWSLIPYYSLFIEAENKSRLFYNGVGFWFHVWDFLSKFCGKECQGYCNFARCFLKSPLKIQRGWEWMKWHPAFMSVFS